jgi:CRP/FNR family cyclic AMP-dependent transcriptional regulator
VIASEGLYQPIREGVTMNAGVLAEVPLLAPVDEHRRQRLWDCSVERIVEAGEVIRLQDEPADQLLVLLSGSVVASSAAVSGRTLRLGEFHAPCVLDKIAVIDGNGHSATYAAIDRCVLRAIPRRRFVELVDDLPAVRRHVIRVLAEQVRGQQRRLLAVTAPRADSRLASWLLEQAAARSSLAVALPHRQQDLAEILGVTRVTVSRVLAELGQRGLIRRRGREVEIAAPELLAALAHG